MSVRLYTCNKDVEFQSWKFPTGEVGVKLPAWVAEEISPASNATIDFIFDGNHDEVFVTLNLIDALKRVGVGAYAITLVIPYLPYSRQDRVCHAGESFALEVFMNVLATTGVTVQTYDVHSKVATKYPWLMNIPQFVCASGLMCADEFDFLVGPDKGSTEKIKDVADFQRSAYAVLDKERKDGMISVSVPENVKLFGNVCIVDDLADGGGTFLMAAKALKEQCPGIESLSLYVTHGFFTKGVDELEKVFDNIYCRFQYSKDEATINFVKEI